MTKTNKRNKRKYKSSRKRKTRTKKLRGGVLDENIKQLVSANIQNKEENLSKMLQISCRNPDNCLALGSYGEIIKRFFDYFRNFSYVQYNKLKRIGAPSANGFVIEIPFKKLDYTAYTVLKCSANADSDNLFYEYYVGKFFINNYIKKFPCFVETYDCYKFTSLNDWKIMRKAASTKNFSTITNPNLMTRLDIAETDFSNFEKSCKENKKMAVLIQHFDNFKPVHEVFPPTNPPNKVYHFEIFQILFQIYFALAYLGDTYTHYDLHSGNVGLYKPFEGNKYIEMRYHYGSNIVKFKSQYITKIIDYGRNYFYKDNIINTKNIIENQVCGKPECKKVCGDQVGYNIVKGSINDPNFDFYWIDPSKPNRSHDLRVASLYNDFMFKVIKVAKIEYEELYGTPENMSELTNVGKIFVVRNINAARKCFGRIVNSMESAPEYDKYNGWTKAATLDVYDDGRDYEFNVVPET